MPNPEKIGDAINKIMKEVKISNTDPSDDGTTTPPSPSKPASSDGGSLRRAPASSKNTGPSEVGIHERPAPVPIPMGRRRADGNNLRARGESPRQLGTNPRAMGTNPQFRLLQQQEEWEAKKREEDRIAEEKRKVKMAEPLKKIKRFEKEAATPQSLKIWGEEMKKVRAEFPGISVERAETLVIERRGEEIKAARRKQG